MLSLDTLGAWATAEVDVTVGAATETWTCPSTAVSAFAAAQDLVGWANAAARAWFGVVLFDWTWSRQAATAGATLLVRSLGGAFTYAPSADAQALLGIAAGAGTSVAGAVAAVGTWAPSPSGRIALRDDGSWLKDAGEASGVGTVRPGVPGASAWMASCRPVVDALDVARLTSVLVSARSPRAAWLRLSTVSLGTEYLAPPNAATGWKRVALGAVSRGRSGASLWTLELAIGGEAV